MSANIPAHVITTEEQYEAVIAKIEELWESPENTPEHQALMKLIDMVHVYEGVAAEDHILGAEVLTRTE